MCLKVDYHDVAFSRGSTGCDVEVFASCNSSLSDADVIDCKRVENVCLGKVDITFRIAVGEFRKAEFSHPAATESLAPVGVYEAVISIQIPVHRPVVDILVIVEHLHYRGIVKGEILYKAPLEAAALRGIEEWITGSI